MAQKYYNSKETATALGISVEDVKKMLDARELHGYRDGADWKFKVEDIDQLAKKRTSQPTAASTEDEGGDVLLSEVALGQVDLGASGTVIGMEGGASAADSDIQLVGSDIKAEAINKKPASPAKDDVDSKVARFEELDLTLDEDITLDESSVALGGSDKSSSAVDLSGKELEDDDLVLGGSGKGSDVTIGGDSGISLVDPADSGLSLEQPLNLAGAGEESLELGEDDMLAIGGSSPTQGKGDDDFLLTPMEEESDKEESASGSQVIALDTEGDESATLVGASSSVGTMAAMLDEDLSGQPAMDMGAPMVGGGLLAGQPAGLTDGVPLMQPSMMLPETPYTGLQIAGLAVCSVLLMVCGMMMYDLLRNMWSWDGAYTINSSLMDGILNIFEK